MSEALYLIVNATNVKDVVEVLGREIKVEEQWKRLKTRNIRLER